MKIKKEEKRRKSKERNFVSTGINTEDNRKSSRRRSRRSRRRRGAQEEGMVREVSFRAVLVALALPSIACYLLLVRSTPHLAEEGEAVRVFGLHGVWLLPLPDYRTKNTG